MRVLVFGGNRFMGKALVDELLDLNLDVTIFNRSGTGSPYVKIIKGDRLIFKSVANTKQEAESDLLYQMMQYFDFSIHINPDYNPTNTPTNNPNKEKKQ